MNSPIRLFTVLLGLTLAHSLSAADAPDEALLRGYNDEYVRAFLACDVARYRELLADDFRGVLSDGRVIDKAEFLREAAQPSGATGLKEQEVTVREYGDTALVEARISYLRPGGISVQTRYTDVYVRREGKWQIVSAQFTRTGELAK